MNPLLDTHIFLWYISADSRLAPEIAQAIREPENRVYLSPVSLWECLVKHGLGKLPLPDAPETWLPRQRQRHGIATLDLDEASVRHLAKLPPLHRDLFDRMLICQAIEHGLVLVTVDEAVRQYPIAMFEGE
ncbi:type II toxin-antitoxin system VapC family toxin [Thiohalocapsa marina]|uniref:Type II toxin-antitoxin system VapC family toxin n=1 Tax=Thiohalocapsa marina TaxID=424902 RepID=A0A5M8FIS7_9GAMM|nr:type II toxin-antitoxin system VapC family toxin [Thiohalocapsa marina]KAA6183061.1 type II toxin-antitoxin system VapC family toxin [Thiohalocapsa marina]